MQVLALLTFEKWPGAQGVQADWPDASWNHPAAHIEHVLARALDTVPAEQLEQWVD